MHPSPAILVLGNANVDLVLGEIDGWPVVGTEIMVERSEMRPGGSAGNSALALTGLDVDHLFIASTGNDPNGAWLRDAFSKNHSLWIVDDCPTTLTVGIVHKGGDRAFFTTPGHLDMARVEDLVARLPDAPSGPAFALVSGGFLMPGLRAGTSKLLDALHAKGWQTAIDPGWPPEGWQRPTMRLVKEWLDQADIALLNEVEAAAITGEGDPDAAAAALAQGKASSHMIVIKQGAAGASAYANGQRFHASAPSVRVIDTVGAGDTFNAGFLAALARGEDLSQALTRGVTAASRAVSTSPRRYTD